MKLIGKTDDFELFEREPTNEAGWSGLKLVRAGNHRKRNWWLSWNGERLADGKDRKTLAEHNPEIERWIIETLSALAGRPPIHINSMQ